MKSYLIRVKEPIEIPAITIETKERAKKGALFALLAHEEDPNIVRAEHEGLYPRNGISVVRRPDGGNTWYHSSKSRCITFAKPVDKYAKTDQNIWGEYMVSLFGGFSLKSLNYSRGDLYQDNGRQTIGLSGRIDRLQRFRLHRACWYEANPKKEIEHLLEADGVDMESFLENTDIAKGFFDHAIYILKPKEVLAQDYISKSSMEKAIELQKAERVIPPKTCIGGLKIKI